MRLLPVLPVVTPLITAAVLALLTKLLPRGWSSLIAIASAVATAAAGALLFEGSLQQPIIYWFGNWKPKGHIALGISFAIDPIGAGLATFAAVLTAAALIYASKYFDSVENHFHALILCFLGAMCGFSLTGDMFNLFVFFELMSAAAFALCAYKTEDPGALQGALNFAVTNTIGAYFVLTGLALLYARTGALNMAQMSEALAAHSGGKLVLVAFAFVSCGYLVKAAVVPFHFWLADAHAVAPSPVCVLFSGVMVEMGLYAVTRIYWAVFDRTLHAHIPSLRVLFISIGVATALLGAIMCFSQRNLKRLLAFSTISHVGLMTLGIGLFTAGGLAGAALYTVGHGLVKGGLFLAAGILLHRFSTVDELDLHGRGRTEKWAGFVFFAGALGLAGLPPSGVSAGDDLIHEAAQAVGYHWIRWISFFAGAVTSAAVLRATCRIFFGWGPRRADEPGGAPKTQEARETDRSRQATPAIMTGPAVVLVMAGILLSFTPHLKRVATQSSITFQNPEGYTARVLRANPEPTPPAPVPADNSHLLGIVALVCAAIGAVCYLFSKPFRSTSHWILRPLGVLHTLHSGHVGDYVAFLTFGIAAFGLVCIFCLK